MAEDTQIRVLPIQVANKIAAGEVVERPASVAKELMENALDAGATQLDVAVTAGGRKLVSVSDNGSGMSRDDALLSIERHATSKIHDVDDIETIHTLGFRGEALAAIGSVSRFRLTTCRQGEVVGSEIIMSGGALQDVQDIGCPPGTAIEVRDLFFNVPARRKFLRSQQTELFRIRDTFTIQALSHPEVGMSLTIDGRELHRLPATENLNDRLRELFSPDLLKQLRDVDHKVGGIVVGGKVSVPTVHRGDRNEQYVFVNGRPTSPALLSYAVQQGYRGVLPKGRHPSVFLFLTMPPGWVDVNVHPTKREIRFRRPGDVRDAVIAAIQEALAVSPDAVSAEAEDALPDAVGLTDHLPAVTTSLKIDDLPPTRAFKYPRQTAVVLDQGQETVAFGVAPTNAPDEHASVEGSTPAASTPYDGDFHAAPWAWCRVLGQVGGFYVVLETENGMVMMDPRAAHERVLYDRFMRGVVAGSVEAQTLLIPETVELPARDAARVRRNIALFQAMGFGMSEFGGNSYVIDALPACFEGTPVETLIVDMARSLEEAGARGGAHGKEDALAQAACRSAVGTRQRLSLDEIERLVVDLAACEMPYTSPRGRPTLIFTSLSELHKKFGRV
ncbi:MAG: DNA mismatch repair endonuclease MutL [Verrucomicrobia bacterium]|nr:DNA mismatch repair endonuclease MutL [Verrucomicrobiota bacterium]